MNPVKETSSIRETNPAKSEDNNKIEENKWINNFLTEKSHISSSDSSIQAPAEGIISSETLKDLVEERYLSGKRFLGWTTDGPKGFTEVNSGDIWINKTGKGTELFTLGYECINSKNKNIYRKIGIKYAFEETTPKTRKKFAREILGIEAQAMYIKCNLSTEMGKRELVKDHYLEIYDNQSIEELEKIEKLKEKVIEKGVVYGGEKPAYKFYQEERYDQIVDYYREQIKKGLIS